MNRVMFYCQHVLGMGHLVRSLEIVRALRDYEVCFLNGGEITPGLPIPPAVHVVNLPPLKSDAEFEELQSVDTHDTIDAIQQARLGMILDEFDRYRPNVVILELFPFGRKRFARELVPLLARIRRLGGRTKVVCSVRDILVGKSDQTRHEEWVVSLLNRYFDLVLVHADPSFQTLDTTFSRTHKLTCEITYTGFVAQRDSPRHDEPLEHLPRQPKDTPLIVASVGGGRVGFDLLQCAIHASRRISPSRRHRMVIFTGPYMSPLEYAALKELLVEMPHVNLQRYTERFLAYLARANLSVSMAGYNTCMNIVSTGIPALLVPFAGRGNEEQGIRARKLEMQGNILMLEPSLLEPEYLARHFEVALTNFSRTTRRTIDIDGAQNTSIILDRLLNTRKASTPLADTPLAHDVLTKGKSLQWRDQLRRGLERLSKTRERIRVFLRDDDIDEDEATLRELLDIALSRNVPINLQIIPAKLTDAGIRLLKDLNRINPALVSLNQHGWSHANHEPEGRKCEFGQSRSLQTQCEDIARGKTLLESIFPIRFYPVFTPPWNRCTADTFTVLDALGFAILSKDAGAPPVSGYGFTEISTTLDLYTWKGGASMKPCEEIVHTLLQQMESLHVIGLLLHHKVMDASAFMFLDLLLRELCQWPTVEFCTFQTLAQTNMALPAAHES